MRKKTALLLLSLPLLVGAVAALWLYARPAYHRAKEARFVRQTAAALAREDYRTAWLSAQQTVRLNPTNAEAVRVLVDLAMRAQLVTELDLRRRFTALEPSLTNRLQLAAASLRLQRPPYPVAAEVLEDLAATAEQAPQYHLVAAELALKLNQRATAVRHLERAATLDPTNGLPALQLAVLQLDGPEAPAARARLEALADDPAHGNLALSRLVTDHLRRGQIAAATTYSQRLLTRPDATLADRLRHLEVLSRPPGAAFSNHLASLQAQVATNASQVFQLSAWLVTHDFTAHALRWLRSLPETTRAEQPVPVALADTLLAAHEWAEAEQWLDQQQWADMNYLRLAFLSETARQLRQQLTAESRWRAAVREAGERLGALTHLATLARDWQLNRERTEVLWQIIERYPRQRWALRDLDDLYLETRNLRGLARVYQMKLAYEPDNMFLRNNLAAAHLLLNQAVPEAAETARALHAEHPENPVIASTHAFALHKLGRTQEGLAAFARVPKEFLQSPGVAVYYAVLLAAAGQTNAAQPFAAAARRGQLLPEELQLLTPVDGRNPDGTPAGQP
jgi:predicted Zn-dependent protease